MTGVSGDAAVGGEVTAPDPSGPGRADPSVARGTGPGPAAFRVMEVVSVGLELPEQHPLVTLREAEAPGRALSFRVGLPEGTALAHALARTRAPRPLTHDLFAAALRHLAADVAAVRLVGRRGSVYLAEMDLMAPGGRQVLECRPSDGITLALRQPVPAPVLADGRLLTEPGDVRPAS